MHLLKWAFIPLLSVACIGVDVDLDGKDNANTDSDGDGISDADEAELGTNPNVEDSDGDGYSDGEELEQGFDPIDPDDHPYLGGYNVSRCDPTPTSTGNAPGEIAEEFALQDQYGEQVRLSDFCGNAVLLIAAAEW